MMNTITVELTWQECQMAALHGVQRRLGHLFRNTPHKNNLDRRDAPWDLDIESTMAELAVCKHFGHYWSGIVQAGAKDAGPYQVRSTAYKSGRLLIQKDDDPSDVFILVVNDCPRFQLVGWIRGKDAQQKKYWTEKVAGRPCYWVDQGELQPIATICKDEGHAAPLPS